MLWDEDKDPTPGAFTLKPKTVPATDKAAPVNQTDAQVRNTLRHGTARFTGSTGKHANN